MGKASLYLGTENSQTREEESEMEHGPYTAEKCFLLRLSALTSHISHFSLLHNFKSITYVMINVLESSTAKSTSKMWLSTHCTQIRQEEHLHGTDVWNTPNKLLYVESESYLMQRYQEKKRT